MKICVIDGQGGGIGKAVIESLIKAEIECEIIGVGTNATASSVMKKAGAKGVATGENAVVYNVAHCDVVIGPLGILFGNAMYGEISPTMASAIGASEAEKYLIPISQCHGHVLGVKQASIQDYINELIEELKHA